MNTRKPPPELLAAWIERLRLTREAARLTANANRLFKTCPASTLPRQYQAALDMVKLSAQMQATADREMRRALRDTYGACYAVTVQATDKWLITLWIPHLKPREKFTSTMLLHKSLRQPVINPRAPAPRSYQDALKRVHTSPKRKI